MQIALHVEDPQYWDCRYAARPTQIYDAESQKALADFRLVSKTFCRSASPRLFREVNARMTSRHDGTLQSLPLNKLLRLSRSDHAQHVRTISVGVAKVFHSHDESAVAKYINDLGVVLPACFPSYPRLCALRFSGPCYPGGHKEDHHFPEELRRALRETIENTLGNTLMRSLTDLSLALPLTHDFAALIDDCQLAIPNDLGPLLDLLSRLRHLDIKIDENSGHGGQHWMLKPKSGVQKAYPNEKFASGFFEFIEQARNVESLRIRVTHVLDMDLLVTSQLRTLRVLELENLKLSIESFCNIIERNIDTLRAIDLDGVQLKSGTWKALLLNLCCLPHLDYFSMDACSYAKDGLSGWLAPTNVPDMDSAIETRSILDFHALGHLQRQVMHQRDVAGLPQMTCVDFKYASWVTLDEDDFPRL